MVFAMSSHRSIACSSCSSRSRQAKTSLARYSPEYSSAIVRHTFDRDSPISQYATVPKSFVFIQRINLGLYAILGELHARGNYRRMAEELWPMTDAAPSTPMGQAEAEWLATKADGTNLP